MMVINQSSFFAAISAIFHVQHEIDLCNGHSLRNLSKNYIYIAVNQMKPCILHWIIYLNNLAYSTTE